MKVSLLILALGSVFAQTPEEFGREHAKAVDVMQLKEAWWNLHSDYIGSAESRRSVKGAAATCVNGRVNVGGVVYPCDNVNFLSLIGRDELKRTRRDFNDRTFRMSDIWGWQSPNTGREYTIACMTNVLWFVDSTNPVNPRPLAWMESHRAESSWCDPKVYQNTAYVVQDRSQSGGNDRGVQVFDLLRLEQNAIFNAQAPVKVDPDFTYTNHGASHNLVIDTESGFLYSVGNSGGQSCNGGLHMIDLSDRLRPTFAGCASSDGYTHDAQCIVYSGPDIKYRGEQICFAYNEDTLTIWKVTDKSRPVILSKTGYRTSKYTHQGWLNKDQDFVVLNDELDEVRGSVANTRSYIVDVSDLDNPSFTGFYDHGVRSIDHNLYFFGDIHARGWGGNPSMANPPNPDYMYCSNYNSGLRIIDTTNIKDSNPQLQTVGFFDVSPQSSGNEFVGVWSSYMHPSGTIALNVIESGIMFVEFPYAFDAPEVVFGGRNGNPGEGDQEEEEEKSAVAGFVAIALMFIVGAAFFAYQFMQKKSESTEEKNPIESVMPQKSANDSKVANPMFGDEI